MILVGNRRGGSDNLTAHLLNTEENEHVELHEVRGFVADDLGGALHEAYGISRGTRCKKFLYSLSLSPPETETVPVAVFETAIEHIEQQLGFTEQPRAIVFHEKKGRRHAHVVWSRINAETMTAIDPYQDKLTLEQIARELFQEHQWPMPAGLKRREDSDPLAYSHAEYAQAKRVKRDPKDLKRLFRQCWEQSDSRAGFAHALQEHGFILARGDRRGFVAVDRQGEVYSVSRYVGVKARELRNRFGSPDDLPTIEAALGQFDKTAVHQEQTTKAAVDPNLLIKQQELEQARQALVLKHREARVELKLHQEARNQSERTARAKRLPTGLGLVWSKLSGAYRQIVSEIEVEAKQAETRDRHEQDVLIQAQLEERRALQAQILSVEKKISGAVERRLQLDPNQALVIPPDPDAQTIKERVRDKPETILEVLTETRESFSRNDILRALAKHIDDPLALGPAIDEVMRSSNLVEIDGQERNQSHQHGTNSNERYSTEEFLALKNELSDHIHALTNQKTAFVSAKNIEAAIQQQSKQLKREIGAFLSRQQQDAIRHGLEDKQLSAIVGLAGTGKSTILSAIRDGYERQGYTVHGAALSGKAADGLEQASNIKSRTLASWSRSWERGYEQLTKNDVFIIDEAGMIGTKQLLRFAKEINRAGAKLLLVGDPEQLQPINAGRPFKEICETTKTARLTEIHRQKEQWQKQASLDLAEGRVDDALETYKVRGHVIETADTESAILRLAEDYIADFEFNGDRTTRLAIAHRRKDVHTINQTIRAYRKSSGDLTNEIIALTDHGKRALAKGDRIVFTKNDRDLNVRNGTLGTITSIANEEIIVKVDGEPQRKVKINPTGFRALDHGYSTTIHKSQGATVDKTFILKSGTLDENLTYVAMTRHRLDANVYESQSKFQKRNYNIDLLKRARVFSLHQ